MYKSVFKRILDICVVLTALLVIWPLLLFVTIWLHFANNGAGAFFTQDRPGRNGKIFKVIKFKTMTDERDEDGVLLPDGLRNSSSMYGMLIISHSGLTLKLFL